MNIAKITPREVRLPDGTVFVEHVIIIGKAQGFLGLPIRTGVDAATGHGTMTSAWEPSPGELAALNAGANVHVQIYAHRVHPPIRVEVGEPPGDDEPDELTGPALLAWRVAQAAEVLCNYGGAPACAAICDALEGLGQLNDDLWNDHAREVCERQAEKIKQSIDDVLRWREHRGKEPA